VLRYYISPKTTVLVLSNFLHMLNTVVARFVTDGNAIGYVKFGFVVDVMFSHNGANGPESKTTRVLRPVCQMAAPKAKSGVCCCISLSWLYSKRSPGNLTDLERNCTVLVATDLTGVNKTFTRAYYDAVQVLSYSRLLVLFFRAHVNDCNLTAPCKAAGRAVRAI